MAEKENMIAQLMEAMVKAEKECRSVKNCRDCRVYGKRITGKCGMALCAIHIAESGVVVREEPETKGDRVRAMSDPELAGFLAGRLVAQECLRLEGEGHKPTETQKKALFHNLYCTWLDWLRQPAEDGDNDG